MSKKANTFEMVVVWGVLLLFWGVLLLCSLTLWGMLAYITIDIVRRF
jgi:hypothetical protein